MTTRSERAPGKGGEGPVEGRVALISSGGDDLGRATALALAACGVRVVVSGLDEKALGEVVGEIVAGGGKARHLPGNLEDPAHAPAVVKKAIDSFGELQMVVACPSRIEPASFAGHPSDLVRAEATLGTRLLGTYRLFHAAVSHLRRPGRLVALVRQAEGSSAASLAAEAGIGALIAALARELAPEQVACDLVVVEEGADPAAVAERFVLSLRAWVRERVNE